MAERWIQKAIRKPGALRQWLNANAHRPPWGLSSWERPGNEKIDPRLIENLIDQLEELKAEQGGLTAYQRRALRRLVLARTLKTMHGPMGLGIVKQDPTRVTAPSWSDQLPEGPLTASAEPTSEPPKQTTRQFLDFARSAALKTGRLRARTSPLANGDETGVAGGTPKHRSWWLWTAVGGALGLGLSATLKWRKAKVPVVGKWHWVLLPLIVARMGGAAASTKNCREHMEWREATGKTPLDHECRGFVRNFFSIPHIDL